MPLDKYAKLCADKLDELHKIKALTATNVDVDGIKRSWASVKYDMILDPTLLETTGCDMVSMFASREKRIFSDKVCTILKGYSRDREMQKSKEIKEGLSTSIPMDTIDAMKLLPVTDVVTNKHILIDRKTHEVTTMDFEVWEQLLDKEDREMALEERRVATFLYDPYDISTLCLVDYHSFQVLKVNTYMPPVWRRRERPEVIQCPPVIDKFLKHLIPGEECRKFVVNWLHTALVNRNETYLVLNGSKGIGKGILASLARMLVGLDNYNEAPVGLLSSQFNSALDKKRIISMDEFKVGKAEHTKLKRYINKLQTLEKKGVDADKLSETYNSYLIQNNDIVDMHIETDDRRFSVPDLTSTDLQEVMTTEEINAFTIAIEEDEDLAHQFGYWVLYQGDSTEYTNFSVWKGVKFFKLAYNSLYEWQKFLVDKILLKNDDRINIKNAGKEYKKENLGGGYPRNMGKVSDFFANYKHNGSDILGELVQDRITGEWELLIDDKYCPTDYEASGSEDIDDLL